jgi:hypothetical protein
MTQIETWARENNILLRLSLDDTRVERVEYCVCGHAIDRQFLCCVPAHRGITYALQVAKKEVERMEEEKKRCQK